MAAAVRWSQLSDGLEKIDQSLLPGKLKVWCYQFTLYHRLMWPLKLCDITSSVVQKMDSKANNYIGKWLGLPRCLSNAALFRSDTLRLPMKSISLGYKLEKVRLVFEIKNSPDLTVQNTNAQVKTGKKWNASNTVHQATTRLKHQEVFGIVQQGRAGLGCGKAPRMWSKASKTERNKTGDFRSRVQGKVELQDQSLDPIPARAMDNLGDRVVTWTDLWRMPQARLGAS